MSPIYVLADVPSPVTITYGGLDLNDGTTYRLLYDFAPGERIKTWDEYRSYSGLAAQYNVSEGNLIEMNLRILVQGTSPATLAAAITAINDLIDAGAQDCIWDDGSGAVTYSCVHSPRVNYVRDVLSHVYFRTIIDMVLYRLP